MYMWDRGGVHTQTHAHAQYGKKTSKSLFFWKVLILLKNTEKNL